MKFKCILFLLTIALTYDIPRADTAPKNPRLEEKLEQAIRVKPTPQQVKWQQMEFIAFIHFTINTFTDKEWGDGTEDPTLFNPTDFDARQWVQVCKDAGMKMIILTAKHHDGFCLWPSKYTQHSVKNSPWRNGKGDIVKKVSDACREAGLKFGVYLSLWDRHEPSYGTDAYNDFYLNQLKELLTNYGEITELWLDGAKGKNAKDMQYDWAEIYRLARKLQPNIVIKAGGERTAAPIFKNSKVSHPDIRWIGNEDGMGRMTEWSVIPINGPILANDNRKYDLGSREQLLKAERMVWWPAEADVSIRPGWFYHPDQNDDVKSLSQLLDIYYKSVGQNAVLLLNLPPDRRGRIHDNDIKALKELRQILDSAFDENLARDGLARASNIRNMEPEYQAYKAVDGNFETYWTTDSHVNSAHLEIEFGTPLTFNRVMLQEYIPEGQRIEKFNIKAWNGVEWRLCGKGTTIGYKRLLKLPDITTQKIKLEIIESRSSPMISEIGLFRAPELPNTKLHYEREHGPMMVDHQGLLSQHDIVYKSPPTKGWEGLVIGDGEAGARIWNPSDRIMIQVNHSSFWNDRQSPRAANDHGARIEIQTGVPLFDWKYLTDYQARMHLHDARATLQSRGSMGRANFSAFFSHPHKVMVLDYHDQSRIPAVRRILLERIGSQYFGSFYRRDENPELNLQGTRSGSDGDEMWIEQELGSMRFAVVVKIQNRSQDSPQISVTNDHQVESFGQAVRQFGFRLYLAMAHSRETSNPLKLARHRIEKTVQDGFRTVKELHQQDWNRQWTRSFIYLPQDRYIENLYYLIMYQNISSRRGLEPPYFIDSIFNWKRDVRAWQNVYLHWNMFSGNFPLFAAGYWEQLEPYFRWKERQLPYAIEHAKKVHDKEGAFFTDFATFQGKQLRAGGQIDYHLTPGPQIAMEFYQYWQYSRDDRFLKERALPFLRGVTRFYLDYIEKREDGLYHIPNSVPYEFHGKFQFHDCLVDIAHIQWLFPALINAEKRTDSVSELSQQARRVLRNLVKPSLVPIHNDWLMADESGTIVYANRFFRGEPWHANDRVWAIGYSLKDNQVVSHMEVGRDTSTLYGVFCGAPTAPAFPPDWVNVDASPQRRDNTGKNSEQEIQAWEVMRNALRTIRKFPEGLGMDRARHSDEDISWTGHSLELPAFARLGLADNLQTAMHFYIQKYQMYPMGMWCYWGWQAWKDAWHFRAGSSGERIKFPADPRILHASTEPTGIFGVTVQEMLLNSSDGVVRLFPAYEKDASFGLYAVGGFFITSRQAEGKVDFVRVQSLQGNDFTLSDPWPDSTVVVLDEQSGKKIRFEQTLDRIRFKTDKQKTYIIRPMDTNIVGLRITDEPRTDFREHGKAQLGKQRNF